jgi:hypothetical protein
MKTYILIALAMATPGLYSVVDKALDRLVDWQLNVKGDGQ